MNRLKINSAAIAILLGLSATVAFKSDAKKVSHQPFASSWFTYDGSGSLTDPANYSISPEKPDCPGSTEVCALQAPVGANQQPVISTALGAEISNAISNHQPSANVSLRD